MLKCFAFSFFSEFSDGFSSLYNNVMRNQDVTNMGNNMFEAFVRADIDQVLVYITSNKKLVGHYFCPEHKTRKSTCH